MPIYEYVATDPDTSCRFCLNGFEQVQKMTEPPLSVCPECNNKVRKTVSLCRAAVVEASEESTRVTQQLKSYEKEGMYSHAAELADKHSEKTSDSQLKNRAKENYKKAGYQVGD